MRVVKASGGFIGSRRRPCHFVEICTTFQTVQANVSRLVMVEKGLRVPRDPSYWHTAQQCVLPDVVRFRSTFYDYSLILLLA